MNDIGSGSRKEDVIPGFLEKFANTNIDVMSLEEAKSMIEVDSSIAEADKANALAVVEHISKAT